MSRHRRPSAATPVQWVVLLLIVGVVGVGIYYAGKNPDTEWGPIVIGAMGLLGLIVRGIFKPDEEDGYGSR